MNNRLNKYRDDLTYPEWLSEHSASLKELFLSFSKKDDEGLRAMTEKGFQAFTIGIYLGTEHAQNITEQGY